MTRRSSHRRFPNKSNVPPIYILPNTLLCLGKASLEDISVGPKLNQMTKSPVGGFSDNVWKCIRPICREKRLWRAFGGKFLVTIKIMQMFENFLVSYARQHCLPKLKYIVHKASFITPRLVKENSDDQSFVVPCYVHGMSSWCYLSTYSGTFLIIIDFLWIVYN